MKRSPLKRTPTKRHTKNKKDERKAQIQYWESKANADDEVFSENAHTDGQAHFLGLKSEPNFYCICHIISKGSNPALRTDQENFVLLTPDEHNLLDHFGGSSKLEIHDYIQDRIMYLKRKYNEKNTS